MKREELDKILKILEHIKNPDARVEEAILIVKRKQAEYNARSGQLRRDYEYEYPW